MFGRLRVVLSSVMLLLVLLYSCGEKPAGQRVFYPPGHEYPDTACAWLASKKNFHSDRFYPVFEAYYARKLRNGDYTAAAKALEAACQQEMYFVFYRNATRQKAGSFRKLYGNKLSWDKLLFLDAYEGNYHLEHNDYRKAINRFKRVTRHKPVDFNTCEEIAYSHSDMAYCYSAIGRHQQALQHNLKALSCFNRTNNLTGKGNVYDHTALVHLFTKNYDEAEIWFDKAMTMYRLDKDTANMFTTLHNKILLYDETGNPAKYRLIDSAYRFFVNSGIEDDGMEVSLSAFYVEKLVHEQRTDEAKTVLDRMKPLVERLSSPTPDTDYNVALAQYEIATGKGMTDIATIEKALEVVEENEDYQHQLAFCEVLKENALLQGDYKKALLYSEKEKAAQNNLATKEVTVKTLELSKKHQSEKKEHRIALQRKAILNKNTAIALLAALLVAFCFALLIVLLRYKQRKIRAEGLRALQYTRKLLEKTEEERKRIAGDLHDSVSHELLNLKHTIGNGSEAGSRIDGIIHDIRIISRNLHPVMFEKVGLAASLEQLAERTQNTYNLMVTTDIGYDGSLSIADELQVYRIVQEALSNTIKYASAVAAKISLLARPEGIRLEIRDNGKGFSVTEQLSAPNAFGLHNILERSRAIGGVAKLSSGPGGTVITIEIKKR